MFIAFTCYKVGTTEETSANTTRNHMIVRSIADADLFFSGACHEVGLSINCTNSQYKFVVYFVNRLIFVLFCCCDRKLNRGIPVFCFVEAQELSFDVGSEIEMCVVNDKARILSLCKGGKKEELLEFSSVFPLVVSEEYSLFVGRDWFQPGLRLSCQGRLKIKCIYVRNNSKAQRLEKMTSY